MKESNWQKTVERKKVPPTPILWKFQPLNKKPQFLKLAGGHIDYLFYWENGFGGVVKFYFEKNNLDKINNLFFNLIIKKNRSLIKEFRASIDKTTKEILSTSSKFTFNTLGQKTNKELYQLLENYKEALSSDFIYGFLITVGIKRLQDYLREYLMVKIQKNRRNLNINKCFTVLTTHRQLSWVQKEERSLIKIIQAVKKNKKTIELFKQPIKILMLSLKKSKKIDLMIKDHYQRFFWLPYEYIGPTYLKRDFIERVKNDLTRKQTFKTYILNNKEDKLKIIKKLKIDKQHQNYFEILTCFTEFKDYRNGIETLSFTRLEKILKLIAKRLDLTREEVYFIHPNEFSNLLLKNKKPIDLKQRQKYYIDLVENNIEELYSGTRAKKLFRDKIKEEKLSDNKIVVKGMVACPGIVKGKVRVLKGSDEVNKMKKNEILVTMMTTPDYIIAVKKAKAIVTDEGGLTSHAAIVSREFNIPCIVGTKVATRIFKTGDLIEVDAHRGAVNKLK